MPAGAWGREGYTIARLVVKAALLGELQAASAAERQAAAVAVAERCRAHAAATGQATHELDVLVRELQLPAAFEALEAELARGLRRPAGPRGRFLDLLADLTAVN